LSGCVRLASAAVLSVNPFRLLGCGLSHACAADLSLLAVWQCGQGRRDQGLGRAARPLSSEKQQFFTGNPEWHHGLVGTGRAEILVLGAN